MALAFASLALIAVICITADVSLTKESVSPGSLDHDVETAKADTEPETLFVETEIPKIGSVFRDTRPTKIEKQLAAHIGALAQAPKDKVSKEIKDAVSSRKSSYQNGGSGKLTKYQKNCMTFKAWAMNEVDEIEDLEDPDKDLEILPGIIKAVAPKGDCTKQFEGAINKLRANANIMKKNSIAKFMVDMIEENMHDKRGIVLWRALDSNDFECQKDPHLCVAEAIDKFAGGQFIYLDANRIGWSGKPAIFRRFAVRSSEILKTVASLEGFEEEDIVKNHLKEDEKKPAFLTPAQGKELLDWPGSV